MGIKHLFFVFLGGGIGAACRWGFSLLNQHQKSEFPTATLAVNLLGCFLIGVASSFIIQQNSRLHLLLIVGFLGGFTTFSSFGLELFRMQAAGNWKMFTAYFLLSNVLGILLVVIGNKIVERLL